MPKVYNKRRPREIPGRCRLRRQTFQMGQSL